MDTLKMGIMLIGANHIINVWWEDGGQVEPSTNANNFQENFGATQPNATSFVDEEIGNLSISNSSACTSPTDKVLVTAL